MCEIFINPSKNFANILPGGSHKNTVFQLVINVLRLMVRTSKKESTPIRYPPNIPIELQ